MASFKKQIKKMWDIEGLASDLRGAEWYITEGPRGPEQFIRIDRMIGLPSYQSFEGLAEDLLPKKEIDEAKKTDTMPELLSDAADQYLEELAELVAEAMKEHVYGTWEEGDGWLGQYEEGTFQEMAKKYPLNADMLQAHGLAGWKMAGPSMEGREANELAVQFVNGASNGTAGNIYIHGNRIYSYGPHFPIAERRYDGIYVTTRKSPSVTTSGHINAVKRAAEQEGIRIVSKNLTPET